MKLSNIVDTINEKLPEDLVVPEHTKTEHFYRHTVADKMFPSVTKFTGIMDAPYLRPYIARVTAERCIDLMTRLEPGQVINVDDVKYYHTELLEEAGKTGNITHEWIENFTIKYMEVHNSIDK